MRDDLLLVSYGDPLSVKLLAERLQEFANMSGLRVSAPKLNIYIAGTSDSRKQEIIHSTGFIEGTLPFRYLGIPLASAKLRRSDYRELIDCISHLWPHCTLSYAGKIELIRSVLQGIECFWALYFSYPMLCY
ncbi:hypothetical protein F511_15038 [Dorcoceras hygrometricum]|uniref:Reverse transcriptase domain-containing protein n=1 Tax=Dorcoceras hygrometricum TaxID=472368 RepID=A0A2Z7BTY4_9LAMI|nr:hypothetical protein F511_15038 [Dorcoceras hygrometricum]